MSENTTVNTNAVITDATATTDTTKTLNIPNKLWSVKHARAIIFIAYMAVVVVVMCFLSLIHI